MILTLIFWAVCFGVGMLYLVFDNRMQNSDITKLVPVGDSVLQVDSLQRIYNWDTGDDAWAEKLKPNMAREQEISLGVAMFVAPLTDIPSGLGPVFDATADKVVLGMVNVVDPTTVNQPELFIGSAAGKSSNKPTDPASLNFESKGRFPRNSVALFDATPSPLIVTGSGELYRLDYQGGVSKPLTKSSDDENQAASQIAAKKKTPTNQMFAKVGSLKTTIRNEHYVDLNQSNQEIAIYRRGELTVFETDGTTYQRRGKVKIQTGVDSTTMSCRVSYQGDVITLVLGNGQVITVDGKTLKEKNGYLPETRFGIESVKA